MMEELAELVFQICGGAAPARPAPSMLTVTREAEQVTSGVCAVC